MWRNWVNWRIEYRPDTIRKEDLKDCPLLEHFKMYKHDKENNPCVVITPGYYDGELDVETCKKVCVYTIEKAMKKSDKQSYGTLSVIFDRQLMTQSKDNKWFPIYRMMGQVLQDYYPERLNTAYVVNANWFTKVIISM